MRRGCVSGAVGLLLPLAALLGGCASAPPEGTSFECRYDEVWTIRTEPSGARVYINEKLKGTSPLNAGAYAVFNATVSHQPKGAANYPKQWRLSEAKGTYQVSASKRGYASEHREVAIGPGDAMFQQAFGSPKAQEQGDGSWGLASTRFRSLRRRNIVLFLKRAK